MDLFNSIKKLFSKDTSNNSKDVAVERLRLVLVHDRADLTPGLMQALKEDLIQVISKYMDIDKEEMDVTFDSKDLTAALIANIPVKGFKRSV